MRPADQNVLIEFLFLTLVQKPESVLSEDSGTDFGFPATVSAKMQIKIRVFPDQISGLRINEPTQNIISKANCIMLGPSR